MKARPTRFMRKPFFVTGLCVSEENMEDAAEWCRGEIVQTSRAKYVKVPVRNSRRPQDGEATVGTWIVRSKYGGRFTYKVYTGDWLDKEFVMVPLDEDDGENVNITFAGETPFVPVQSSVEFSEKVN